MRRVGTVVRTAGGLAIARGDPDAEPPRIGASVVDESPSTVGRVVDGFGPVDQPYVAVTPGDGGGLAD
ncbi:H/ACA RNA-protein complex component Gar1, partial [Halorubrum sp. E3]